MDIKQPDASVDVSAVMRALSALDRENRRFRARHAAEFGLAPNELLALLAVGRNGSATPKAVAEEVGLTSGSITSLLDRLEASGHVHRVPNPVDRRSVLLELTEAGAVVRKRIGENLSSAMRAMIPPPDVLCTLQLPDLIDSIGAAVRAATCISAGLGAGDCAELETAVPADATAGLRSGLVTSP